MTIKTPIGYTTRDDIFVRDRNIATEILGQLDFIDMIFLAATGQTPSAPMTRMANGKRALDLARLGVGADAERMIRLLLKHTVRSPVDPPPRRRR